MYGYPDMGNMGNGFGNNFNSGFGQNHRPISNYGTIPAQDERIWVQNETSAEAYLLAPNGFARLWDSSNNRFYEKRADATGRPLPMDIYEYKRVTPQNGLQNNEPINLPYDEINAKIEAINERIDKLEQTKKGAVKNGTKSVTDDTSV